MRVEPFDDFCALESLAADWNRLSRGVPFRSHEWLTSWWRFYGDPRATRRLLVLLVRDASERLVGLAPWFLEESLTAGAVIRFLGSGETYSDYLSVFAEPGHESRVATAITNWLEGEFDGCWSALELTGVDAADLTVAHLLEELEACRHGIIRRPDLNCWRVALPGRWEQYLALLSKSHRKQIRRAQRRLAEDRSLSAQSATTPADVAQALDDLIYLHQRRQRSLGRMGCFASPEFASFHREVAVRLAAAGQSRIDLVRLNDRPIAAEYQLVGNDVVYAYQAGIEPDCRGEEPGRLAMTLGIRRAIEQGYRAYDFLRGDEPYKAHWRGRPRATLRARVVARGRAARFRSAVWLAQDLAKTWVKQNLRTATPA